MWENTDQKNSVFGQLLHSGKYSDLFQSDSDDAIVVELAEVPMN